MNVMLEEFIESVEMLFNADKHGQDGFTIEFQVFIPSLSLVSNKFLIYLGSKAICQHFQGIFCNSLIAIVLLEIN